MDHHLFIEEEKYGLRYLDFNAPFVAASDHHSRWWQPFGYAWLIGSLYLLGA
jgi:hypothetical protein